MSNTEIDLTLRKEATNVNSAAYQLLLLHTHSLLAETLYAIRTASDPFRAHLQTSGMDNLPRTTLMGVSSHRGQHSQTHTLIFGRYFLESGAGLDDPCGSRLEYSMILHRHSHLKWRKDRFPSKVQV